MPGCGGGWRADCDGGAAAGRPELDGLAELVLAAWLPHAAINKTAAARAATRGLIIEALPP